MHKYKDTKKPFVPPSLPPKDIDYIALLKAIVATRDAVARYDEALKRLPNPEIIQHTFETKEAVLSSRIEGTQVTLDEVFQFDAIDEGAEEKTEKTKDYKEVVNYRRAILKGKELLKQKPLTENMFKELHHILLDSSRGNNRAPGEFRTSQVFIGPAGGTIENARFVPPPPQKIVPLFSNLERYLHSEEAPDPVVQIAIAHYQFEAIHPFLDGNGRVGRIIIPLFLYEKEITTQPSIYVSEFLETHRQEYYDRLKAVSEKSEWIEWIRFFLLAVREQTNTTGKRVEEAVKLHKVLLDQSTEFNSIYAHSFIDALFERPVFTAQKIKKIAGIKNQQTLYNLLTKFTEAGIVSDITPDRERNKIYAFKKLLKIVN